MKTKGGEPSALDSRVGAGLEWQETVATRMTVAERVAVGVALFAIVLAAGLLISGCGGSKGVETSSGMSHNQPDVAGHVHDYGTKFLVTAGLLNILAMVDAYEIAAGRKD